MKYKIFFLPVLLMMLAASCRDDDILLEDNSEYQDMVKNGFTLSFDVELSPMGDTNHTRATQDLIDGNPELYESWINKQDGFAVRVFTCQEDENGNPRDYFLFQSKERWVEERATSANGSSQWKVTIPIYDVGTRDAEYSPWWKTIRDILQTNDFKIALYVNHLTSKAELPELTVNDSYLVKGTQAKTINDIHHSIFDSQYFRDDLRKGYDHIATAEGYMGPTKDWVGPRSSMDYSSHGSTFSDQPGARTWIRDYWNPAYEHNEKDNPDYDYSPWYRDYVNIWFLWNFGGSAADNAWPYSKTSEINPHIGIWEERNGRTLRNWIERGIANGGILSNLEIHDGSSETFKIKTSQAQAIKQDVGGGKYLYGVKMPKLTNTTPNASTADCFQFNISYNSSIYIAYKGKDSDLRVNVNSSAYGATTHTIYTDPVTGIKIRELTAKTGVKTNEPVYVFSTGDDIEIYQIEWLADNYVYSSDREAVMPSSTNPIPMYGVQKYNRIGNSWVEGTEFNLMQNHQSENGEDSYAAGKRIALLRSVAKIELLIPKSLGVPKFVYMKSFNRYARCEPVDVQSNTRDIWKNDHDNDCEWRLVQQEGLLYDNTPTNDADRLTRARRNLAWYAGSWLEWGWEFKSVSDGKLYPPADDKLPQYPRVMNVHIQRAAESSFADVSEFYNDNYYHFLQYMGDNPVAVSGPLKSNDVPMVPRIEIMFDSDYKSSSKVQTGDTYYANNDFYTIYFAEKGNAALAMGESYKKDYFTDPKYMKYHWPIIRNHIYRFVVTDASPDKMHLLVDVQHKQVDITFD